MLDGLIAHLESLRLRFVETKDKAYWDDIIQLLPSSYNQLRTCTMNYENLLNMYRARKNHKLAEWRIYCDLDRHPALCGGSDHLFSRGAGRRR